MSDVGGRIKIDDERMGAWAAFLQAHAVVSETLQDELQAERGLSLTAYEVLLRLDRADHSSLRMRELARHALLSKSGLTRLIDRMEQAGLVTRAGCPSDRRGTFAVITPAGRAALRRAAPVHLRGVQEHFAGHLSDQDARSLRRIMEALLTAHDLLPAGACEPDAEASSPATRSA